MMHWIDVDRYRKKRLHTSKQQQQTANSRRKNARLYLESVPVSCLPLVDERKVCEFVLYTLIDS